MQSKTALWGRRTLSMAPLSNTPRRPAGRRRTRRILADRTKSQRRRPLPRRRRWLRKPQTRPIRASSGCPRGRSCHRSPKERARTVQTTCNHNNHKNKRENKRESSWPRLPPRLPRKERKEKQRPRKARRQPRRCRRRRRKAARKAARTARSQHQDAPVNPILVRMRDDRDHRPCRTQKRLSSRQWRRTQRRTPRRPKSTSTFLMFPTSATRESQSSGPSPRRVALILLATLTRSIHPSILLFTTTITLSSLPHLPPIHTHTHTHIPLLLFRHPPLLLLRISKTDPLFLRRPPCHCHRRLKQRQQDRQRPSRHRHILFLSLLRLPPCTGPTSRVERQRARTIITTPNTRSIKRFTPSWTRKRGRGSRGG